jgi:hypothetical protein
MRVLLLQELKILFLVVPAAQMGIYQQLLLDTLQLIQVTHSMGNTSVTLVILVQLKLGDNIQIQMVPLKVLTQRFRTSFMDYAFNGIKQYFC